MIGVTETVICPRIRPPGPRPPEHDMSPNIMAGIGHRNLENLPEVLGSPSRPEDHDIPNDIPSPLEGHEILNPEARGTLSRPEVPDSHAHARSRRSNDD